MSSPLVERTHRPAVESPGTTRKATARGVTAPVRQVDFEGRFSPIPKNAADGWIYLREWQGKPIH